MTPLLGEIWLVNLDPALNDELKKTRPAVVVSQDSIGVLNLRVVVPLTGWQPKFGSCEWLVRIDPDPSNGLSKPSAADTFQVRSVAVQRFSRKMGNLSDGDMSKLLDGLKSVFDI